MKALIAIGITAGVGIWSNSLIDGTDHSWLAVTIPAALICIWLVVCYLGSIAMHLDDLSNLAANDQVVAAEDRLEAVKALAADKHGLPEQLLALKQDDNPVTKYMGLVDRAIANVENEKGYRARIEGRIASRAVGPFSLVVKTFGSSVTI